MEKQLFSSSENETTTSYDQILELVDKIRELTEDNANLNSENKKLRQEVRDLNRKLPREYFYNKGGWVLTLFIAFFIGLVVTVSVNGCDAASNRNLFQPIVVKSVTPYNGHSTKVRYETDWQISIVDTPGKFNVGDTLIVSKK